jgi:hypothetical protein
MKVVSWWISRSARSKEDIVWVKDIREDSSSVIPPFASRLGIFFALQVGHQSCSWWSMKMWRRKKYMGQKLNLFSKAEATGNHFSGPF